MSMDKLSQLLARCKAGVHLVVNEHRNYYQSAQDKLDDFDTYECPPDIDEATRAGILATDNIVDLQFYPDTPIGSYHIVHHDLEAALDIALACR